jgi:threonine/homoserine/homoserine lactone efflux protein
MTTINDAQKEILFNPRICEFLLALLPQFDGSPALQALTLSLLSIASGTAANLLTTTLGAGVRALRARHGLEHAPRPHAETHRGGGG